MVYKYKYLQNLQVAFYTILRIGGVKVANVPYL